MDFNIRDMFCFVCLVFVTAAKDKFTANFRYHRYTKYKANFDLFQNTSDDYLQVQDAINQLSSELKCKDLISDVNNDDCELYIGYVDLQPIGHQQAARVIFNLSFELKSNKDFTSKQMKLDPIRHNVKQRLTYADKRYIEGTESITNARPIHCKQEYDNGLNYTWPDTEINITQSMIYPPENNPDIRLAGRRCGVDGWGDVFLTKWDSESRVCKKNDTALTNLLCYQYLLDRLKKNANNLSQFEVEKDLDVIIHASESEGNSTLTLVNGNAVLSFVYTLMNIPSQTPIILKKLRETIEAIIINYPTSEGHYRFSSQQFGKAIYDTETLASTSTDRFLCLELASQKNNKVGLVGNDTEMIDILISSNIERSNIIVPIKSVMDSASANTNITIDRVGVYVCKDSILFPGSHNVFSKVYSILIPNMENRHLSDNISLRFDFTNGLDSQFKCVFWDSHLNIGLGGWSGDGCTMKSRTNNRVECQCNHLSSFALMEIPALRLEHTQRLNWISIVGCSISSIALILTLVTYLSFKPLMAEQSSKILVFIFFNLLCTNLFYILNAVLIYNENPPQMDQFSSSACRTIAVLFHYFLLASLAWMGANGFYMYKSLVIVFDVTSKTKTWKLATLASGLPIFIVFPTAVIDFNGNYGLVKGEICWLKGTASFVSFIVPVGLFTAFNIIIFTIVFNHIRRISQTDSSSSIKPIITQFKGGVSLTVLLGLTWSFDFMAVGWGDIIFAYLFVVCNSFQGFFLFLFYCVFKENARHYWFRWCQRMKTVQILTTTSKPQDTTGTLVVSEKHEKIQAVDDELENVKFPSWPETKLKQSDSDRSTEIY